MTDRIPKARGSTLALRRASGVPLHLQLKQQLEGEITRATWKPGGPLPTELALAAQYRVSRATVRQALDSLERERLITRRKGSGSYVLEPALPAWRIASAGGFFDEPNERVGPAVRSVVLRAQVEALPEWAIDALTLPTRSQGVTVERLRWVAGRLALYGINHTLLEYADAMLAPGLEHESLYARLEAVCGVRVAGGRRVIEAIPADGRLGALLQVPVGAPLARVESLSWDSERRPFECHLSWIRTDRLRIEVGIGDTGPALERFIGSRTLGSAG